MGLAGIGAGISRRRRVAAALGAACALAALGALVGSRGAEAGEAGVDGAAEHPNVIVVMTDDQDAASLATMPRTRELVGEQGTTFANSFVSFSLCCPSRATLLTGQYAHNHGVWDNAGPRGGFERLRVDETLAVWLQRAGYRTAQVGKVMNGYERVPPVVPPGWDEWHGLRTRDRYYGYDLVRNGELVRFGSPEEDPDRPAAPQTYLTDVVNAIAADLVESLAPAPQPFFLWVSQIAPHGGGPNPKPPQPPSRCRFAPKPAPRHLGMRAAARLPRPPSFDEPDVSDKPPSVRSLAPIGERQRLDLARAYRCYLESLLAVDEGIESLVAALAAHGELERTVLIFTSDNGFLHGEHRIRRGKVRPYEESIRVPLLIRGPGFPAGRVVDEPVSNVDLAPTILELAGAEPTLPQDGRSLLPLVARPRLDHGREIFLETNLYRGVRTPRYVWVEHRRGRDAGARELYDLLRDPYQLRNVARVPRYRDERRALRRRVRELRRCVGAECHTQPRLHLRSAALVAAKARRGTRSRRGKGGRRRERASCGRRVEVEVTGKDGRRVRRIEFTFRGRLARIDRRRPYRISIPRRALADRARALRAQAVMVDGRELTLPGRLRCRSRSSNGS